MAQQDLKDVCVWQGNLSEYGMSKRQKKKAPIVEEEHEVEVVGKVEYTYEDTRCSTCVEP